MLHEKIKISDNQIINILKQAEAGTSVSALHIILKTQVLG